MAKRPQKNIDMYPAKRASELGRDEPQTVTSSKNTDADDGTFRRFIENLPVMFYAVTPVPPHSPIYISPTFEKFGYPLQDWLTQSDIWDRVIHPDDSDNVLGATREAMSKGESIDFEYRVVCRNGSVIWVRDRSCFIKDRDGKPLCWQGVIFDVTEQKIASDALEESEERYRQLFENAKDIIYVHDLDGNYISINEVAERVLGYTHDEALSLNMTEITAPEHIEVVKQNLANKLDGTATQTVYEVDCIKKDGGRVTLEVNSGVITKDGAPIAIQGIARDVTERKLAEEMSRKSEERYKDLFENANDLIYTHDLNGNFTSLNRAGEIITGYTRDEALKMNLSEVVAPEFIEAAKTMTVRKIEDERPTTYELEIIAKDGHRVTLELSTRIIVSNGLPVGVQGIGRDITERNLAEEKLRYYALHDTLTDLPNRVQFMNHLRQAVERADGNSYAKFAVLFLDLDRFKVINDSLGHAVGDKLLIAIAERLTACVRPGDVVARLGGDEFTILLNRSGELSEVVGVAERLQTKISEPFQIDNYEVFTTASIGIIVSGPVMRTAEDFLRDADAAMYRAKESGKARYEIFDRDMHVRNMNLLQVETDLRHAVERNQFEVLYQPIVELRSGHVNEFEALIRWRHPVHGLVGPNEFVGVAEETGLIIPIGKWILEESCRQIAEWQRRFNLPLAISVNLSAKQLMHPTLTAQVRDVLFDTGLDATQLKLEVTESTVMEHHEKSLKVLSELDQLGVNLSTDDFGTGYSSLSYLQRFPFERLKIDRSFINIMDEDEKSGAIVKTILMLGENLNIEVVAEGIETASQLEKLRSLGCTLGQGYLFSRPIDCETAEEFLAGGANVFANNPSLEFRNTTPTIEVNDVQ